ncbi:MAG: hypothetical protein QNJ72_09545 [Pleurocapsa sp. MO_226.B13]|nr:hypothetical protein [Pleurocapsa sp. MO_226.B13]
MNILTQRQLIALLALVIGFTVLTVYLRQRAVAIVLQDRPLTVKQSIPSLPGKLALDETQKENIISINRNLSQQIQSILTLEQLQYFTAIVSQGLNLQSALQDLPLTSEQADRLQLAVKSAQQQIEQVLTPEQIEYIRRRHRSQQGGIK